MAPTFFDLPLEIRLDIYSLVFGSGMALLEAKVEDDSCCMVPRRGTILNPSPRSSQLLRVSRTILLEARPIFYANTVFHIRSLVFAGALPTRLTDGHPCAPHIKHLVWQLDCDMLKHFYDEELQIGVPEISGWSSFEIRCCADTWRDSFLGEWCDREAFLRGRAQVVDYARMFHDAMSGGGGGSLTLVEDRSQLGSGRIILRIDSARSRLKQQRSSRAGAVVIGSS
ncbi:hypothetical protein G647_09837 [Cladophialophora carrionii CBS 160.54]|uniref:F-box domain-containing protein n=1 Tax=Cladophialophora carrionii CBS 160.54 TaxID=1279043 RepID=V9DJW6_9EURO|nr:uncharacterized protein G647_09837 [Cladophialophora carrionii CBS 160.54]ETI27155.1 hypothetical protein G647_09837 [Cladophialophora carrionii CBS 160.54]